MESPCDPEIPLLDVRPKELTAETQADTGAPMTRAALFTAANTQERPSVHKQIDGLTERGFYVQRNQCSTYSCVKKNEGLVYAATQMDLENIALSEIDPPQMTNSVWFHLYEVPRVVQCTETEGNTVVSRGWGERRLGNYCLMVMEFLLQPMKKMVAQRCDYT